MAAAYLTLIIAVFFLVNSPLFNGQGTSGDWTNVTYGILLGSWGVILVLFARRLMVDAARHAIWGSVVVACNAQTGNFVIGTFGGQFLASNFALLQGLTLFLMMTGPALGVLGGLLGVFWKGSWKQGATIPGLA